MAFGLQMKGLYLLTKKLYCTLPRAGSSSGWRCLMVTSTCTCSSAQDMSRSGCPRYCSVTTAFLELRYRFPVLAVCCRHLYLYYLFCSLQARLDDGRWHSLSTSLGRAGRHTTGRVVLDGQSNEFRVPGQPAALHLSGAAWVGGGPASAGPHPPQVL